MISHEQMAAPVELLQRFLRAVSAQNAIYALPLAEEILRIEPGNLIVNKSIGMIREQYAFDTAAIAVSEGTVISKAGEIAGEDGEASSDADISSTTFDGASTSSDDAGTGETSADPAVAGASEQTPD